MCHQATTRLASRIVGTAVIVGLALIAVGLAWVSLATVLIGLGMLVVIAFVVSR